MNSFAGKDFTVVFDWLKGPLAMTISASDKTLRVFPT